LLLDVSSRMTKIPAMTYSTGFLRRQLELLRPVPKRNVFILVSKNVVDEWFQTQIFNVAIEW